MADVVKYIHDLGDGHALSAYAVDPQITKERLAEIVRDKDGDSKLNFTKSPPDISYNGTVGSLSELHVEILEEPYRVPEPLNEYREALEAKLAKSGKFNGPVAVLDGEFGETVRLRKAGYFDFLATKLEAVPSEIVPNRYPAGATLEQLMSKYGIKNEDRARYFAFAFLMLPDRGKEFQLVQRAKGMGIAADCISLSGSTPPFSEDFFKQGFDFGEFYENHIAQELSEEFKMRKGEFSIGRGYVIDDLRTVPHIAWHISAKPDTSRIAEKIHGDEETISEHPVLYAMPPVAIEKFLNRFEVWRSVSFISNLFYTEHMKEQLF